MLLKQPTKCQMPEDPRNCVWASYHDCGTVNHVWCHRFTKQNAVRCKRYDEHWNRIPLEQQIRKES